jgi:hypothetical protein
VSEGTRNDQTRNDETTKLRAQGTRSRTCSEGYVRRVDDGMGTGVTRLSKTEVKKHALPFKTKRRGRDDRIAKQFYSLIGIGVRETGGDVMRADSR